MKVLIAIVVALFLAACTTGSKTPPGPPEYRQGYADGCDTGLSEAGNPYYSPKRDWGLYDTDARYRLGFDEGREACRDRYNAIRS